VACAVGADPSVCSSYTGKCGLVAVAKMCPFMCGLCRSTSRTTAAPCMISDPSGCLSYAGKCNLVAVAKMCPFMCNMCGSTTTGTTTTPSTSTTTCPSLTCQNGGHFIGCACVCKHFIVIYFLQVFSKLSCFFVILKATRIIQVSIYQVFFPLL
jgi:hypothetical protein